eukprot:Hpha_TRINITY_DN16588_c1_g2::TRINITY_DN16588_c1_g2_i1::g.133890::m.133890/K09530/DNAJC10; DnaJ homolog subfamily C member 10
MGEAQTFHGRHGILMLVLLATVLPTVLARRRTTRHQVDKPDLYAVLNLTRSATHKQIRNQFKKWSRMLHPDITTWPKDVARKRMIEVAEAYEVLGDEDRRKTYDGTGDIDIGTKPIQWQTNNLFTGEHDAHVFTNSNGVRRMLNGTQPWMLYFWEKECHECVAHAETYAKFATRMKGVANVGVIDCTNMLPECRKLQVDMNKLPQIKLWMDKKATLYQTKYGKIEVQSLVEWAARKMLTEAVSLTHEYVAPGKKGKKGKTASKTPTFGGSPETDQVWPLVTFEYAACMDCNTELTLAIDGLRKYSSSPMRALRVDCNKAAKFCKKHAPKSVGLAWNVGTAVQRAGTVQKDLEIRLMTQRRQFDARDLLGFVLAQQEKALKEIEPEVFESIAWDAKADSGWMSSMWGSTQDAKKAADEDAWAVAFLGKDDDSVKATPYLEMVAIDALNYTSPSDRKLHVVSVDCDKNLNLCVKALNNRGPKFPQLRLYPATRPGKSEPIVVPVTHPQSMTDKLRNEMEPLEIVRLDPQTYQKRFMKDPKTRGHWYVLYSAGDWCPPCIAMREPWRQMARIVSAENRKVKITIGSVNCDAHKWLCQQNGIEGYPTMRFHPEGGGHSDFQGDRTAEKLLAWGREQIGSRVIPLGPDLIQRARDRKGQPHVVLFTAGGWCPPCQAIASRYAKAARRLAPLQLGKVDCDKEKDLCGQFGISNYPAVVLYKKWPKISKLIRQVPGKKKQRAVEHQSFVYSLKEQEKASTAGMVYAIMSRLSKFKWDPPSDDAEDEEDETDGPIKVLTDTEYNNVVLRQKEGRQHWFILWTGGEWCPPCQQMKKTWKDLALILQDEAPSIHIGIMDCDTYGDLCRQQRMRSLPAPFFHAAGPAAARPQSYPGMRSAEAAADWVQEQLDLAAGGSNVLNPGGGMIELTKDGKPLLALFSAGEWCPPCMAIYARFAKVSKKLPELRMAQVNCDEQKGVCEKYGITSYPSVIFYAKELSTTKSGCVHHIKSDGSREQDVWDCSAKSWMRVLPQDDKHSAAAIIAFAEKNFARIKELSSSGYGGDEDEDYSSDDKDEL